MTSQNIKQNDLSVLLIPKFQVRNIVPVFTFEHVRVSAGKRSEGTKHISLVNLENTGLDFLR